MLYIAVYRTDQDGESCWFTTTPMNDSQVSDFRAKLAAEGVTRRFFLPVPPPFDDGEIDTVKMWTGPHLFTNFNPTAEENTHQADYLLRGADDCHSDPAEDTNKKEIDNV